jgi:hypothetical protein
MKFTCAAMLFLAMVCLIISEACGPLRVHSYLIPAKMEARWVTIEYNNPTCPPLDESIFGRQFIIPESGFLCTSSPMYTGWHRTKYYLVDEKNNRTALQPDERIFRQESLYVNQPSLDPGGPVCKVTADEFFYGPKDKLTYNNPIMQDESFLKLHPECCHSGIVTKSGSDDGSEIKLGTPIK